MANMLKLFHIWMHILLILIMMWWIACDGWLS